MMQRRKTIWIAVVLASMACQVFGKSRFLAEKPPFFKSCKRLDPDIVKCFSSNFNVIFNEWKDGIPGLKSVGSIDPLHVKRIRITQDDNNPLVQMNVDLTSIDMFGLSKVMPYDFTLDFDKLFIKVKILAPKLKIDSDYTVKGRLLNLPLDASGRALMEIKDFNMDLKLKLKLRDEFGYTFTDVESLDMEITDVGGFHLDLNNLFNGQVALEQSTNAIINENWRDFYAVLGPAIKEAVQTIMFDRFRKVYAYIPAQYLVGDIRSAAERSGENGNGT